MRLIAGKFKGRPLKCPPEYSTRPTSSRTREAIFNILQHHPDLHLQGAKVWDVFAGSGAMGLEALSRGAKHVTFMEQDAEVIRILQENITYLGCGDSCRILKVDATKLALQKGNAGKSADLIFLDPPYDKGLELPALLNLKELGVLSPETLVVLETSKLCNTTSLEEQFTLLEQRTYGAAKVSFFRID